MPTDPTYPTQPGPPDAPQPHPGPERPQPVEVGEFIAEGEKGKPGSA